MKCEISCLLTKAILVITFNFWDAGNLFDVDVVKNKCLGLVTVVEVFKHHRTCAVSSAIIPWFQM